MKMLDVSKINKGIIPLRIFGIALVTAVLLTVVLWPGVAYAIDLPDDTPSAQFFVYQNVLEDGDELVLIYQNIPYTTLPDIPVYEAYMWRMIETDNITELGACVANAFQYNGYQYNVTSMYWDSSNVTALGLTWGTSYFMRLSGLPGAFDDEPEWTFTLNAVDYSTLTDTDEVKLELGNQILEIAADLDFHWALGISYSLLNQTETDTVLSIYGETFFRSAVYGIQAMCPQIFAYVIDDLDLTPRTWSDSYVTFLENQYEGTWVEVAKTAGAALFGTTYDLTSLLITLALCAGVAIAAIMLCKDAWEGMGLAAVVLIGMTRLGFFSLGFLAVLGAMAVIYASIRIWGVMK